MSRDVTLEEVPAQDWPALAAGFSDFTYEQDMAYVAAGARRVGARVGAFEVRRKGVLLGAACLRVKTVPGLRRGIAYLSAGPLLGCGLAEEAPERAAVVLGALKERLVAQEGHILRLRLPVTAQGLTSADIEQLGLAPTVRSHSYRTVLLDLDQELETLHKGLHAKWRGHLRKSEKMQLEIVAGRDRTLVERFLKLYGSMLEAKGFKEGFDPAFLSEMSESEFDFEVTIARHAGEDVGGHVTVFTPHCATYLFGATVGAGREVQAGYRLLWSSLERAKSRNISCFDLGGVDPAKNPHGYEFKTRTGGREVAALGPYEAGSRLGGPLLRGIEDLYGALRRGRE